MLNGKDLGREVRRELHGVVADAPPGRGHQGWLAVDGAWAVNVGHNMRRHYNNHAAKLGLSVLLVYETGPMAKDTRCCELQLTFTGGFEVRYLIGDPLEYGLHVGLVLHRLIRRAAKAKAALPKQFCSLQ
jgi:hypothetical protein